MIINKKFLKAYIIEDEPAGLENLSMMLKKYCKDVLLVGFASTIQDAVAEIPVVKPDVVFLDIELPQENGFQLFKYFPDHTFGVIFTTAYSEYAVKAFNFSAIHYILKPIDIEELKIAIAKVDMISSSDDRAQQIDVWNNVINMDNGKLVLPTSSGLYFLKVEDVVWCEAQSNYTKFYFQNHDSLLVSKSLKVYDKILGGQGFFRASRSSLINFDHIVHCSTHKKMDITMSDGSVVVLSERRRSSFKEILPLYRESR